MINAMVIDILIYALIAFFLAWRLYSVLGTRHEGERQRPNPFAPQGDTAQAPDQQKNLLALPLAAPDAPPPKAARPDVSPAPQSLSGILYALQKAEPNFDEKNFVKGSRLAFEIIVHAYAAGEREALQPLVSPVLFEAFKNAIDAREKAGERMDLKLLNVIDTHIVTARLETHYAYITLQFVSDQARAIYAGDTLKEDGAPERLTDVWTFRREIGSPDPNWMLVETKTA